MADELKTMAEELKTTAISKLPEAISVSEGDCILVVQNRKAKKARPSLFRGPKGDIGLTGATGANPVLKFSSRGIEAKLSNQADSAFTLLVPIASITGPTGPQGLTGATGANIIPRAGETGIEYKLSTEPDTAYRLLVPYSQITGPQGEPGKDFQILGYFDTFDLLKAGITTPNPGDAYGVGTEAPYPIYIWDGINNLWRDNGAIQGPAGRSGKSARVNTDTGYWEAFDDDAQTWKQTEAIAVYPVATVEKDGLMSKEAVAKIAKIIITGDGTKALLDNGEYGNIKDEGKEVEVSKENVEKVLTGNIVSHTHDEGVQIHPLQTDVWDGATVSTSLSGTGIKEDPFLIQSCADYIHFYNNPNLYSVDINAGAPDHVKIIKITHNLDFNNNPVDFTDYVSAFTSEEALLSKGLILAVIEGCGCQLSNLNFINTWSALPLLYMSCVEDVNVVSGILSVDIAKIEELSSLMEDETSLCIMGLVPMAGTTSGCSVKVSLKFVGTLSKPYMYNMTAFSLVGENHKNLRDMGVDIPLKISGYSGIDFQTDCDTSSFYLLVNYNPAVFSSDRGLNGLSMTVYDCSNTVEVDMSTEPAPGFYPMMIADTGLYNDPYILYLNSDTTHVMYGNTAQPITPYHIYKSTEEMQSGTFLILLNTTSDNLFIEDISGLNNGYPVFPSGTKEIYEGYVGISLFMQNIPYYVDFDFTGTLYELTPSDFPALKRQYEEPTKENFLQVLGWTGILNLINAAERGQMITFPMKEAYLLGTTTCIYVSVNKTLIDDSYMLCFISYLPNKKRLYFTLFVQPSTREITNFSISVSDTEIEVTNSLNDTTSSKALSAYAGSVLNQKKVESTDVSVIKKLTQAEYDALTPKDDKTLYLIVG